MPFSWSKTSKWASVLVFALALVIGFSWRQNFQVRFSGLERAQQANWSADSVANTRPIARATSANLSDFWSSGASLWSITDLSQIRGQFDQEVAEMGTDIARLGNNVIFQLIEQGANTLKHWLDQGVQYIRGQFKFLDAKPTNEVAE